MAATLSKIFNEEQYADKAIEAVLKSNSKWGSRDRAFVAENVYEVVRHYRLLAYCAEREPTTQDEWTTLVGIRLMLEGEALPDWDIFTYVNKHRNDILRNLEEARKVFKIKESITDWMDEIGRNELGDAWEATMTALNQPASLVIRANTLKTNASDLSALLLLKDIENEQGEGDSIIIEKRANLFSLPEFKAGLFEVQDCSSQLVAPFLGVEPGMRVVDACAGAGGKTLHMAALMKNKGRIIALDTEAWKLEELRRRARRAGVDIIETRLIESTKTIKRLQGHADRLLLDVPCSGLGVLRRNPDAKWKLSQSFLNRVLMTQQDILESYPQMLKPDGQMVYATCSVLPSENSGQVSRLIGKGHFQLLKERVVLPQEGFDGFYMAAIGRKQ